MDGVGAASALGDWVGKGFAPVVRPSAKRLGRTGGYARGQAGSARHILLALTGIRVGADTLPHVPRVRQRCAGTPEP